ncbi:Zn(II)2Cys6 transcription factor [Aspergillus undulatus]|uniref:Zn(II)2Cys6 transcription factor n=1 Tax=Aspergillus undulatus TaxID=1810928 RepID=UPI003CCD95B1
MHPKPFICRFPRCEASYHRKEHRRRHEAQHDREQGINCATCDQKFGRRDTLRRHMRKIHGVKGPTRIKVACTSCRDQKTRCEKGPPCTNCCRRGIQCSLSQSVEVQQSGHITCPAESLSPVSHDGPTQSKSSRSERERHFIDLYFKLFHPFWPFIHQGSFRKYDEAPLLVQSIIVIGLWLSNEHNAQSRAIALHDVLSSAIHEQKELWDASCSEDACSACSWPIPTYQAILLHLIFAVLYKGSGPLGLDLKPCLSPADANLLVRLVQSCKKLGMLYYPNMLARYCQSDLPAYVWVSIEEVKQFNIALYRVCRACSGQEIWTDDLNPTRTSSTVLRANDLQFPLPRNLSLWKAVDKAEWDAAATEDVYRHRLEDTLERDWISKSANLLELNSE